MKKLLVFLGLFLILFTVRASAQIEATVGKGFKDAYNIGGGARYLFSLPMLPLSIGGEAIWYTGSSAGDTFEDEDGDIITLGAAVRVATFGAYGGYTIPLGPISLRPHLTLGAARVEGAVVVGVNSVGVGGEETQFEFMAAPGLDFILPLGPIRLGVDLRYNYTNSFSSLAALAFVSF